LAFFSFLDISKRLLSDFFSAQKTSKEERRKKKEGRRGA